MKSTNILILEDAEYRITAFKNNFSNCNLTITSDVQECIQLLSTNVYDFLFLDHDLDQRIYTPSDERSGFWVAKFVAENPQFKPEIVCLHTKNQYGIVNMKQVLPNAIVTPEIWDIIINDWDKFAESIKLME